MEPTTNGECYLLHNLHQWLKQLNLLHMHTQSGSGSQSLLDNAERYGLLAASRLNNTDEEVFFPGSNIGILFLEWVYRAISVS